VTNEPTLAADVGLESPTYMNATEQNATNERSPPLLLAQPLFAASFNSSIFAGDMSWVAGVELATASEPPGAEASDLGAWPFGRPPQPPLRCNLH
jgi:hypothetical protein